jgi:PAS domain S-box-containing protein
MRVGELSRRTGVGVSTLRAWEARFHFLMPERSPAGHRLYADADVDRVNAVLRLVAEGLALPGAIARVSSVGPGALPDGHGEAMLYGQVLQAVGQGVWVMHDGRTRYANRRMAELMGRSIDELVVIPVDDLFGPVPEHEGKARRAALRQGKSLRFTNTVARADGTTFLAEIDMTPLFDHAGHYEGAVALVQDISSRAEVERQARLRSALLDSIGEAVCATDPEGRLVYINSTAEKLFGLRAGDVVGRRAQSMLSSPDVAREAGHIHERLVKGNRCVGELPLVRADGSHFIAHFASAPTFDDKGTLLGLTAVLTDETERARREAERRTLEAQLETLNLLGAQMLGECAPAEEILQEALSAARRLLQADHVTVFVPGAGDELRVRAASPAVEPPAVVPRGGRSFAGYIAFARTVVLVDDASSDRRFEPSPTTVSAIGAPIFGPQGIRGVVAAERGVPGAYCRADAHFLQGVANIVGGVLDDGGPVNPSTARR